MACQKISEPIAQTLEQRTLSFVPFRGLLLALFAVQLLSVPSLWGHTSFSEYILGRYSLRYAVVLAINLLMIAGSGAVLFAHCWLKAKLAYLRTGIVYSMVVAGAIGTLGIWTLGLEPQIASYTSANTILLAALLIFPREDSLARVRPFAIAGSVIVALLLVAGFITALSMNTFQPDEAHYTDAASTFWAEGRLYDQTWLREPHRIAPGYPWGLASYGWLLETFGYSVRVGRVLNFASFVLYGVGAYAVLRRLYGHSTAVWGALAIGANFTLLTAWDFRPSHHIMPVGVWALYGVLVGRDARRKAVRLGLPALVGLIVTQGLNVHASVVVFALAFTLFYALAALLPLIRRRDPSGIMPALAFGVGALLGTALYWLTNIAPVGGLGAFLAPLQIRREAYRPPLFFIVNWASLLDQLLLLAGIAYLLWRRTVADRLLLSVTTLTVIAAYLVDSEGYIWHVGAFALLTVGVMLAGAFGNSASSRHTLTMGGLVLLLLAGQAAALFVDWGAVRYTLRNGAFPSYFYDELKPLLPPYIHDDVIYSTHQLIWIFPHGNATQLVTYGAELDGMRNLDVNTPDAVWERVQPTVIVFVEDHMQFGPGMQAYLARHPFQVCQAFIVQGKAVTIQRQTCPTTPPNTRD